MGKTMHVLDNFNTQTKLDLKSLTTEEDYFTQSHNMFHIIVLISLGVGVEELSKGAGQQNKNTSCFFTLLF